MAVTNVVFELGPDVTIVGSDGTVLLSPISGASLTVTPLPSGGTASGSVAIDSTASLNFNLNIPAGAPGGKGDDGNDGVSVSTISTEQGDVVAGQSSVVTFNFGMSDSSTKQTSVTVPPGATGNDGSTAYQLAVNNGYTGTETQWLASLVGSSGESAYQIAVDGGFVGTQSDWLASLKGERGDPGPIGPIADTTDWTTQTPINARSAQGHFSSLSGDNNFTGNNTFSNDTTVANNVELNLTQTILTWSNSEQYTTSVSGNPTATAFDNTSGILSGSITAETSGTLTLVATDSQGAEYSVIIPYDIQPRIVTQSNALVTTNTSTVNTNTKSTRIYTEQLENTLDTYTVLELTGALVTDNVVTDNTVFFKFHNNGKIESPIGVVPNCGSTNIFVEDQRIINGSKLSVEGPDGSVFQMYKKSSTISTAGSLRVGNQEFNFASDGSISSGLGTCVVRERSNTFIGNQLITSSDNVCGVNIGVEDENYQNGSFIDFHNLPSGSTSSNTYDARIEALSGTLGISGKSILNILAGGLQLNGGNVGIMGTDIDYGTLDPYNGYYFRIGDMLIQVVTYPHTATVLFPIAYAEPPKVFVAGTDGPVIQASVSYGTLTTGSVNINAWWAGGSNGFNWGWYGQISLLLIGKI